MIMQQLREDFEEEPDNFDFTVDMGLGYLKVLSLIIILMEIVGFGVLITGAVVFIKERKKSGKIAIPIGVVLGITVIIIKLL